MITIIDYGAGNLANVKNAFEYLGVSAEVVSKPGDVEKSSKIILPGVGAFAPAMERLYKSGLAEVLLSKARAGIPLLGICLGMQLLFTESEEDGISRGLDLISGKVKRFVGDMKIPHMGWNILEFIRQTPLNTSLDSGKYAFFVHSYYCVPDHEDVIVATTDYSNGFASIVAYKNIYGMQFHPEKSQKVGLQLLKNFNSIENASHSGN